LDDLNGKLNILGKSLDRVIKNYSQYDTSSATISFEIRAAVMRAAEIVAAEKIDEALNATDKATAIDDGLAEAKRILNLESEKIVEKIKNEGLSQVPDSSKDVLEAATKAVEEATAEWEKDRLNRAAQYYGNKVYDTVTGIWVAADRMVFGAGTRYHNKPY
jgi:hypothetical protein